MIIKLNKDALKKLQAIAVTVGDDFSRVVLTNIHYNAPKGFFEATNGHVYRRETWASIGIEEEAPTESFYVNPATLKFSTAALKGLPGQVLAVETKAIEPGYEYPNTENVVPITNAKPLPWMAYDVEVMEALIKSLKPWDSKFRMSFISHLGATRVYRDAEMVGIIMPLRWLSETPESPETEEA